MGANDKVAATFHAGEYTPSERYPGTARVRERYLRYPDGDTRTVRGLLFDRWLDDIRAEAKAEALEEAASEIDRLDGIGDTPKKHVTEGQETDYWRFHSMPMTEWLRARANQYKEEQ